MNLHKSFLIFMATVFALGLVDAFGQDATEDRDESPPVEPQDDVSKALDSTATQWSFQLAWQQTDWKTDIVNGLQRPQELDNFAQLRIVAPFVFEKFTILPRLTMRHYENVNNGDNGLGNTEQFGLIIPKGWDWGTGRGGIGPLIALPGNDNVARDAWDSSEL
jgi:hypothetical protein